MHASRFRRHARRASSSTLRLPSALALNGKGRIEHLSDAPSGRVDFALQAATADSLRIAAGLFGLPEGVSRSKHLSRLAPLECACQPGRFPRRRSDQSLHRAWRQGGRLRRLARGPRARRPRQARRGEDRYRRQRHRRAAASVSRAAVPRSSGSSALPPPAGSQGKLTVKLSGVPNTKVTGKAALETAAMERRLRRARARCSRAGLPFAGKGAVVSQDASLALTLLGFEAPPSAAGVPLESPPRPHQAGPTSISTPSPATIAGEDVTGSAHFDLSGAKTRFALCRRAPTPCRCRRCSACWWRGTARPRPRRCWARSAPALRGSGRRAASRSGRSRMPKARSR